MSRPVAFLVSREDIRQRIPRVGRTNLAAPRRIMLGQRDDHAEAIALFAKVALVKVGALTKDLESILGPGTGELALRFGIHSGPVTAGVLRGEKARFQVWALGIGCY